ncbi:MAG: response regulator [Acidobacteriia bacterium]|nr:response regulator [Terriglobia bacterium]
MDVNNPKTILIADDDSTTRDLLREVFEEQRYVVITVSDGRQAAEWLKREIPCHVLLADLRMPYVSGLQLIQGVRKTHPQVRCVLITTCIDSELLAQAEAAGIAQVFEKPVNVQQLLDCVEGLVASRPQPASVNTNPVSPP